MSVEVWTAATAAARLGVLPEQVHQHIQAGKGIVIYENQDLGHPQVGHCLGFTWGTPRSQFTESRRDLLPTVCPDGLASAITGGINWRYWKIAIVEPMRALV